MDRSIRVRGIIINNNQLLCARHKSADGTPFDFLAIPGGGLDVGEGILAGLHREIIEETGIAPAIGRLLFVQQFINTDRPQPREDMEFFFHIENANDYATVNLATTSHGEAELASLEWVDPSAETILPAFLQQYDITAHLAEEKPVFFYTDLD